MVYVAERFIFKEETEMQKKWDKLFQRMSACVPVVVMMLTAAPLSGFVGSEWPKLFAAKASAAQEYTSGDYTYTVLGGNATGTGKATLTWTKQAGGKNIYSSFSTVKSAKIK